MRLHNLITPAMALMLAVCCSAVLAQADGDKPDTKPEAPTAEELFTQGRDALFTGDYDKAIGWLEKAVAGDDTKTNYRLHLARAYRYADKQDKAAEQLEKIVAAAPDHVEADAL